MNALPAYGEIVVVEGEVASVVEVFADGSGYRAETDSGRIVTVLTK